MELRILLRSAGKAAVLAVFLCAAAVAAMLLLLQSYVDGVGLRHAEEHYSYIGTVRQAYAKTPDVQPISQEALQTLEGSGCISEEERRTAWIGRAEGLHSVPDVFLRYDLSNYCIVLGTVAEESNMRNTILYEEETALLEVEHIFAGNADLEPYGGLMLNVVRTLGAEPMLEKGTRGLFVCRFSRNNSRAVNSVVSAFGDPPEEIWPGDPQYVRTLFADGIRLLPSSLPLEQAIAECEQFLDERGLTEIVEAMRGLNDRVTLRGVEDMELLLPVSDGTMFFSGGRALRPDDAGKQVCVVSAVYANENGLKVGDTVELYATDGVYISGEQSNLAGVESGFPDVGDAEQDLARAETSLGAFKIIGTYAFSEHNLFTSYY